MAEREDAYLIYKNYDRMASARVMQDVFNERLRQHKKYGLQAHDNGTGQSMDDLNLEHTRNAYTEALSSGCLTWREILTEEVAEAYAERVPARLRAELVQVAAVAIAWAECLDRKAEDK